MMLQLVWVINAEEQLKLKKKHKTSSHRDAVAEEADLGVSS
jgi:hypothetical protein